MTVAERGRRQSVILAARSGHPVPGLLTLPAGAVATAPVPGVLLLHGYSSHKEQMAGSVGLVLMQHGIASLAIDLPMHGERRGDMNRQAIGNPLALATAWRQGLDDAARAWLYLVGRDEIDAGRCGLVGYSMGSFLGVEFAARTPAVKAVVLAAGGDLPPQTPFAQLVRTMADPLRAVQRLAGRPLLMVHGRHDAIVTPLQAQRLYDAARAPKDIRWWDAGHRLPQPAIDDAAEWMRTTL
jgi:fermentation-respiration switch protein FrsA (DUF1100 family)